MEIPQEWPTNHDSPWFATPQQTPEGYEQQPQQQGYERAYDPEPPYGEWYEEQPAEAFDSSQTGEFRIPSGPNRTRPLQVPGPRQEQLPDQEPPAPAPARAAQAAQAAQDTHTDANVQPEPEAPEAAEQAAPTEEQLYQVFRQSIKGEGIPTPGAFAADVETAYGVRLGPREVRDSMDRFTARLNDELLEDHIA
ncbi:hypothetical protein [Streptomyces sp. KLOTTS4A1]|uniref:hypothetical protein n=1 Tax=Streptomyces sp. KLOTTS4A1 TaxID=3390996 RepID=UPI0039F4D963